MLLTSEKGSHKMAFGPDIERYFRGYYDPIQQIISVAVPRQIYERAEVNVNFDENDIPEDIKKALYDKFGFPLNIKVF